MVLFLDGAEDVKTMVKSLGEVAISLSFGKAQSDASRQYQKLALKKQHFVGIVRTLWQ